MTYDQTYACLRMQIQELENRVQQLHLDIRSLLVKLEKLNWEISHGTFRHKAD